MLVVAPTDDREERVRRAIWRERPRYVRLDPCCSFWTSTAWRVRQFGPAAAIWLAVDIRADEPPGPEDITLRLRSALDRMTPMRTRPLASSSASSWSDAAATSRVCRCSPRRTFGSGAGLGNRAPAVVGGLGVAGGEVLHVGRHPRRPDDCVPGRRHERPLAGIQTQLGGMAQEHPPRPRPPYAPLRARRLAPRPAGPTIPSRPRVRPMTTLTTPARPVRSTS